MANTPNLGLRKIDAKTEKFNQKLNYEDNFDKIDLLAGEIRAGKVDKVTGKVLSTNDYTTLEKTKLSKAPDDTNASLAAVTTRVNDIITTPVPVGEVIAQEIIDARQGKLSVGANITEVKTQLADNTAKLKDITQINIRDYGAKSHEEVANFDNISALKNVIAYANSIGGHTKIFIPKGTWKFGATPVDMPIISENGVWFAGDNEDVTLLQFTSGTYFTWGSVNKGVEGGGIEKLSLEYLVSNAEYPTIKNIYSFGVTIRNVKGKNLSRLIEVGSRNNPVGIKPQSIKIHNCTFISAIDKANISLIKLIYGAVFECNDVFASVPIPQVMGQNNVLENVNFLEVNGSWDTVNLSNVFLFQYYTNIKLTANNLNPTEAMPRDIIVFVTLDNCLFDYTKYRCIDAYCSSRGQLAGVFINSGHYNTFANHCFSFKSDKNDVTLYPMMGLIRAADAYIAYAGKSGFHFEGSDLADIQLSGVKIQAPKQSVLITDETCDGIYIDSGISSFFINNCVIDNGGSFFVAGHQSGITVISANSNLYNISGNIAEKYKIALSPTTFQGITAGRHCKDNIFNGDILTNTYSGYKSNSLYSYNGVSGVNWYNVTPFDIEVFIFGGVVSAVYKGSPISEGQISFGVGTVTFILSPGDYFKVEFSGVPYILYHIKQ